MQRHRNTFPLDMGFIAHFSLRQSPSFRPLLSDALPGVTPPAQYADLDF
jgi:hypothetical protein